MSKIEQVGFIGLGLMGTSMSNNLLKAGFKVKGYDPLSGAGDGIRPNGGEVVPTPGETGEGSQLVIVMVPDVPEVDAVLNGDDGLLKSPGDGRVIMVMCTIDPGAVLKFAEQARVAGWGYVDSPVGRTADDARDGTSMFMVAGSAEDKATVMPALEAMGTEIIDCGDVGHGMTCKIVNNFMSTVGAVMVAEALRLAESGGVGPDKALEVINGTIAGNGHSKVHFPRKALAGNLNPGFAVKHARKDVNIARTVMEREGFPCYTAKAALEAYDAALDRGHGDNDWSDLYNVVNDIWSENRKG
jgi:4-hydroxybutyrate dehydrogenase/sulfolactaldehyde 3-reductase